MWGGDRLSVLPDDLLLRILHFAPVNEAASTTALSKRWRGLWCSSGAVNLVARVPERTCKFGIDNDISFYSRRDAFVSGARLALEAAGSSAPVTRLSFCVEASHDHNWRFLYQDKNRDSIDVLADLLSLPAARHVEELRITTRERDSGHLVPLIHLHLSSLHTYFYGLSFLSLPSETLRVLDLTSFGGLEPSTGVSFPRLESLRMSLCNVRNKHLQAIIDVSPALATIHLQSLVLEGEIAPHTDATGNVAASLAEPPPLEDDLIIRIDCPAVTALVLDRCRLTKSSYSYGEGAAAVEIHAPKLRRFTYKGVLRQFSLTSQATDLAWADLHIIRERYRRNEDARRDLVTFWGFARNFSNAKELKLRVSLLEQIAVVDAATRTKLLCSFLNLECLEIEGAHGPKEKTAAVAIANLLRCSPMLRDLRINLSEVSGDLDTHHHHGRLSLERKYRHDLDKSIHGFENRRSQPVVSFEEDDTYDHLSDLPALSGRVFPCLQTSLRRVGLQFRMDKTYNNFGVKLIKFFAQNAMLLEEMQIDSGNGKMQDHINCDVERWFANSSNDRKTSFVVLPLERQNHHDI